MSTLAIILIALGVVIASLLILGYVRNRQRRDLDNRRLQARLHRDEAQRREAQAEEELEQAQAHARQAEEIDPDLPAEPPATASRG